MVIRATLSAMKLRPSRRDAPAAENTEPQREGRQNRVRGGDAAETGRPPARRNARAAAAAPAANAPVNTLPIDLIGRVSSFLPANEMRVVAEAVGRQGVADVSARRGPQAELRALKATVVATVENVQKVVNLKGFMDALGTVPSAKTGNSRAISNLREDVCAYPILQLMNRISVLPANDRSQAQAAIAAKINEIDPALRSDALAAVARIAQDGAAFVSAMAGENLALISVFHGFETFDQVEPLLEIIFNQHALPAVLAGAAPRDVAARFGLHTEENLERLEQTAALPDGVIGQEMLIGANAQEVATHYGFRTEQGIGQLQATAYIGLRESSELKEASNVAAVAARHGIVEPSILGELEAVASLGRAGRAAQAPRSNVQSVAAAHGIVTAKGIEALEMSVLESRVGPALLKLQNIRSVAAQVGITSPNTLLTMEYFAINHLPVTMGDEFHWQTPQSIATRLGIESATGLETLQAVMVQAQLQDFGALVRISD